MVSKVPNVSPGKETAQLIRHMQNSDFLLGLSSTPKTEVINSLETSDHIRTTWRYIPEDSKIEVYLCENPIF
jgi:hypothetical protein